MLSARGYRLCYNYTMYLDRTYRPKRRRGRIPWWPIILVAAVGIFLFEQQPAWLVERAPPPTPTPAFSASKYLNDAAISLEVRDFDGVLNAYQGLAESFPNEPVAHIRLAELSLMNLEIDETLAHAERAVDVAPDNADALAMLARAHDWKGDYVTALRFALDGQDIEQGNPNVLAVLGEIYTDSLSFDTARGYLDEAYEIAPRNPLVLRNLGWLEEMQRNYEESIKWYEAAIKEAPHRYDIYIELGRQYTVGLNEPEKAIASYEKAVEIHRSALTLDALGYALFQDGEYLRSIRTLEDAIELDPTYGLAHVHLGFVYYRRLNYEDAAPSLNTGVRLLGDEARIEHLYSLGLALIYQDEPKCDEAIPWLRKALEINENSPPALAGLSQCGA